MKILTRMNRMTTNELLVDESIFALSNGYIGIRGNFCEGYGYDQAKQTYMNSFYNTYDYKYEENSIQFPQTGERIVNIIDGQTIEFKVDSEAINMRDALLLSLERHFDLEKGYSARIAHYKTPSGKELILTEEKIISFSNKELLMIKITLSPINFESEVEVRSALELPKQRVENRMDPRINISLHPEILIEKKVLHEFDAGILSKTSKTNLQLYVSMSHDKEMEYEESSTGVEGILKTKVDYKNPLVFTKYVVYSSSLIQTELLKSNHKMLSHYLIANFDQVVELQQQVLSDFWSHSLVEIDGSEYMNEMIQYNIYQLNANHCGLDKFNISSKGLSGEGYEGHYFWDTEIYMFPFFLLTNPKKAASLIKNRYIHLKEAKIEALKLGVIKGAKIPWRTIKGNELSPYYPAGSAQFHINSDVAYTVIKYFEATKDINFMIQYGFELLIETGRFLLEAGNFENKEFHINTVTGPDEYSAIVNDNYYTNAMAKYQFEKIAEYYKTFHNELNEVLQKLYVNKNEIDQFVLASKQMVFIFDEKLEIYAQDAQFLKKPILDLKTIPKENFPLLLHYHPLFIYRHQVLKQADTLLAMQLLNYKNMKILKNTFDYYLPLTTHDSSLSKCIYSIIAAKLGDSKLAFEYLLDVLKIDFENSHNNTHHGLHIANLGGSYLAIVHGFLGLEITNNFFFLHPVLPNEINGYTVNIIIQDSKVCIKVSKQGIDITVDKPINIGIYNEIVSIKTVYHCGLY
ncbi:MAG: glycosyl hydrolase family 65 protein [Candidatus Izemoplasmatales bacterium]|nr:glycosyl hydrolase family 65 protein [Candidatus Izemoplasmatales bacterium]